MIILVKYGEIILKGLNRPRFEAKLADNIRHSLGSLAKISRAQAVIYVEPIDDNDLPIIVEKLTKVFGIVAIIVARECDKSIEAIRALAIECAANLSGTFKVEAKRADKKFPLNSPQICATVGEAVLNANCNLTVNVNQPDHVINVEVRDFNAYVHVQKTPGAGGIPVGTSGKATLLLSGGIDSPVAGYSIAKRGVALNAVHFYSYPYTSPRARDKVIALAEIIAQYSGKIDVHVVPFTNIQLAINKHCPAEQMTILMRVLMMRIAEKIAISTNSNALITGESLGQVASQTIHALGVTNRAVESLPVLRPLIGMDKEEIVKISRNMGAFETSILPYEDCCTVFTPKHPTTKPKQEKIDLSLKQLDVDALIDEAIAGVEVIRTSNKIEATS
ncbi:MAG: tRNA 4-thiouridine(8) synthase ThiI [Clostridiales bacterium]|jgi:thiamine biosynthesis protein ThiI|nr:tRNA 4-thiouridine(8) synthase ThiI [Clostridiales bacterium]